jgi:hypothetical protein
MTNFKLNNDKNKLSWTKTKCACIFLKTNTHDEWASPICRVSFWEEDWEEDCDPFVDV